jgi:sugar phosphate isomerase/epimerase
MQRLGTQYVRIMSYAVREGEDQLEEERFRRLREITRRFVDAGLTPVHENCMNYGGMSWKHALRLLENVPDLKWVFDTANPVFNDDRSLPAPQPKQDPWEFWHHVKEHVVHIHVKDAIWDASKNDADYTLPGEGDAAVHRILKDAMQSGYDAGISIEPHLAVVFHDDSVKASDEEIYQSFLGYGRALIALMDRIKSEIAQG